MVIWWSYTYIRGFFLEHTDHTMSSTRGNRNTFFTTERCKKVRRKDCGIFFKHFSKEGYRNIHDYFCKRHLTISLRLAIGPSITLNPGLSYRRFTKSSSLIMPTPLTREMFISIVRLHKGRCCSTNMVQIGVEDNNITEVPVPEHVKETGIIPEGYSIGSSFNRVHLA